MKGVETWKLVAAYLGWLLASSAIALLFALLLAEVVGLLGVLETGSTGQRRLVDITAVAGFVLLALVPFLLRGRFVGSGDDAT
ncbi:MAG: hypothetical protein BMS9Abin07_0388 [Acidimicrobiia bacterium]|nr:MAG: hypothetical protein BMS9Abin07_0388 [Acidimicrobiia bacterium]